MTWLLFVLIMQTKYYAQDTGNECSILGRLICWKWCVPDSDKTSEKRNCSIWNKFYINDVYWNQFNIEIVICPVIYVGWYFGNSLGIKNSKQLGKRYTRIIANWVLKLKIKMSQCCIILNNMQKNDQ